MAERVLAYRARAIGAELRLDREPDVGTRVLIRYPLTSWQDHAQS
jgi:nitrate/nitrite-specific signal transduction histidine kinase